MTGQKRSFFVYDMMGGKITRIHGIRGKCRLFLFIECPKLIIHFLVRSRGKVL